MINSLKSFFQKRKEKQIQKWAKLVRNKKAIKEDRMGALHSLKAVTNDETVIPILLDRFDYSLEHGIVDEREKAVASEAVLQYGSSAASYIKTHLKESTKIAWPIKLLKQITTDGDYKNTLLSCLNYEDTSFHHTAHDKNFDILCYLRDCNVSEKAPDLFHFLEDSDERVRFAAVECLIEQEHAEIPPKLEPFLKDYSSENRRVRKSVVRAFINRKWQIQNPKAFNHELVDEGVFLTKTGYLESKA